MAIQYVDKNGDAVSTVAGPYAISGTNNTLSIIIDGGAPQTITLTSGAARTAAQVVTDINTTLTGALASAIANGPRAGRVRIRTVSANGATSTIAFGTPANDAKATLGFTGSYTGFARGHTVWSQVTGTKQELINKIETELLAVGWTTISGSGTTTLLMQSALTPPGQDLMMRLRVKDNAGSCVTLSIENVAGTVVSLNNTTQGGHLLPAAAKQWLFTCNKYQFCIRQAIPNAARGFVIGGMPALPTHLQGVITEALWIQSSSGSDTSTGISGNFRLNLISQLNITATSNCAGICNGVLMEVSNYPFGNFPNSIGSNSPGAQLTGDGSGSWFGRNWHDNSALLTDALICWSQSFKGHLWDACLSSTGYAGDSTTTFDGNNWIVITDNNVSGATESIPGTLLLVTP